MVQRLTRHRSRLTKLASSVNPARWLFSGWNCTANTLSLRERAGKASAVVGGRRRRRRAHRHRAVAVHEVEPAVSVQCLLHNGCGLLLHLVPAHVWNLEAVARGIGHVGPGKRRTWPENSPRQGVPPFSSLSSSRACIPDADAQQRSATRLHPAPPDPVRIF